MHSASMLGLPFGSAPAGPWWLGGFQDDDDSASILLPAPGNGDPIPNPPFPQVTITSGETTTQDLVFARRM